MESAPSSTSRLAKTGFIQVPGALPTSGKGETRATSIILKTAVNAKRQHAAIGRLVQMCRESAVVTHASRGITAEVRRDRDHGHD